MERTQFAALVVSAHAAPGSKSESGDPLSPIAGKSIAGWIVDAVLGASVRRIGVVAVEPSPATRQELADRSDEALIDFVRPTGDLVESLTYALERIGPELTLREGSHVLILPAEAPQIEAAELRHLIEQHIVAGAAATVLSGPNAEAAGEPHIATRADGTQVFTDAAPAGVAVLCIRASLLVPALRRVLRPSWLSGTPIVEIAGVLDELGHEVAVLTRPEPLEPITSIATRTPIEVQLRDRIISNWIERGVIMPDPRLVSIDATVELGQGVTILPGSILEGVTVVADDSTIGPNSHLINATIGSAAVVPHSVVDGVEVGAHEQVAPFSVFGAGSR